MNEKRGSKRTELLSRLIIKRLDGSKTEEAIIDVTDLSKTGIGFESKTVLNIGAVYEAFLTIWTRDTLHAFVEIVRIEKKGDMYSYGGIFIGMPEMDAARIDTYQTVEDQMGE